ncbi:metallophosphoesterase family protein [Rhodoligotrophos defluvii]|uniref:metallophosphoesterase family protein n=1 Tax=Rhodoligotrophos defluvii TaxID=2561934 RepID=UPI0010C96F88|nr:DNA repair exonuclease [Rhodoligotrophos defluvii]
MRIIHTADWQIGKPFKQFGAREAVLQDARLVAIETIGALARREGAAHVLVAGDVYDSEAPALRTLLAPLERMRQFPEVHWHLMPGNHDPHRPKGVWDRVRESGVPDNVHLHLAPEPAALGSDAVLLPSPLTRKSEASDLTEWMDRAATPEGLARIGLAHGSVTGFGSEGEASNPIDPRRLSRAGLSYLALGDWHRTLQIGPSIWYAGTPEPDRAGSQEIGQVLVIDIRGPAAPPLITPHRVGRYRWLTMAEHLDGEDAVEDLEQRLRGLPELSATVVRLVLSGALSLTARADLDRRLTTLAAAAFALDVDLSALAARPTLADLEAIDFGGVLRDAADRLRQMAEDPALSAAERRRAEEALVQLFTMVAGQPAQAAALRRLREIA